MKFIKNVQDFDIELYLDVIKHYKRFSLYQVSKLQDGVKIPLYQECYTDLDLKKIITNDCKIIDEIDNESENLLSELEPHKRRSKYGSR